MQMHVSFIKPDDGPTHPRHKLSTVHKWQLCVAWLSIRHDRSLLLKIWKTPLTFDDCKLNTLWNNDYTAGQPMRYHNFHFYWQHIGSQSILKGYRCFSCALKKSKTPSITINLNTSRNLRLFVAGKCSAKHIANRQWWVSVYLTHLNQ